MFGLNFEVGHSRNFLESNCSRCCSFSFRLSKVLSSPSRLQNTRLVGDLWAMEQESWKMDKDETGRQPPEGPILCANNCGFFGSSMTMDLCSQCYRNHVLQQAKAAEAAVALSTKQVDLQSEATPLPPATESATIGEESAISASTSAEAPQRQQPNRCFTCKKRIGLTGFKCRCGNQFCSLHRHHDKHNCSYDYRAAARDAIAKANPVIKADKLDKL